jgi:polysaccharide chain length determinant protein (PEP-CTERM system associated)
MPSTANARVIAALAALRRRKWLAFTVFGVVLSGVLSFAKALPNLYQSSATILVERPVSGEGADAFESSLQSIRQEILSRSRLAELIGRFELYPGLRQAASQEAVVQRMRRDVLIEASGFDQPSGHGTIAFSLAYRGADPEKVTLVANAVASSYIEEAGLLRDRQTRAATSALERQLEDVRMRLTLQETRIAEFKKSHPGELPQQADASLAAVERLGAQQRRAAELRSTAMERRAALLREGSEPETAGDDPDPDRARLERLGQELAELRTRFSDRYPDVVHKQAEYDSLAALVARKPKVDTRLPQLEELNKEIRSLQAEESRLRGEIGAYRTRIEAAPWREQEYQTLSRDYATTREFYDSLLKRLEEAQLAETHEGVPRAQRLRLLDPAIVPRDALAPDRFRLAMFGLIASLGLAVVAVAAAERLDTSFHSASQLRSHTRVPILSLIPRVPNELSSDRTRAGWRVALLALGLGLAIAAAVSISWTLARGNESFVALFAPRGGP